MNDWYEATLVNLTTEQRQKAREFLAARFAVECVEAELSDGTLQLSWYLQDEIKLRLMIASAIETLGKMESRIHPVDDTAWQQAWQDEARSFTTEQFHIILDDDPVTVEEGKIPIHIRAGEAFGDGQHATTLACLRMLERTCNAFKGDVLDLGTGTGILAIAAAKLGAKRLVGTEIDDTLTAIAAANAQANQVKGEWLTVPYPDTSWSPFDLIISNILIPPLFDLMPACRQLIHPSGRMMLAGFIGRDLPVVEATLIPLGFALREKSSERGWLATIWEPIESTP